MARKDRTRAHPESPFGVALRGLGNFYAAPADPRDLWRHTITGGNQRDVVLHDAPERPSVPILPRPPQIWQFRTLYDINATNVWGATNSGTGTVLGIPDERPGIGRFTNGAGDNNFYFYESIREITRLIASRDIWFICEIKVSDATQSDLFVGLSARLASGNLFDNRVDSIGFYSDDGDAYINTECNKNGSATQTAQEGTLVDDTWIHLGFHVIGTVGVEFFIGNRLLYVGNISTNLPDDTEMCVAFGLRNGEAVAKVFSSTFFYVMQD